MGAIARGLVPLILGLALASVGHAAAFTLATETTLPRVDATVRVHLEDASRGAVLTIEEAHGTDSLPGVNGTTGAHFTTVRWGWSELFVP